jgi:exodeoxyribonuclease V alpha subunit
MTIPFVVPPEQALAEGFAERVVRWARDGGASGQPLDALRAAARATSLATAVGHVCTYLADIGNGQDRADEPVLRAALLACGMVGTPDAPGARPLILDAEGRVYLHRYFDYERRLARRLAAAAANARGAVGSAAKALLENLFAANTARLAGRLDWQKVATALALVRPLTIVSGGPGTGKTTTVVNVLACALADDP